VKKLSFAVKIPESSRMMIFQNDNLEKHFYLKFPEIVFCFDFYNSKNLYWNCSMKCFYHKSENLYACVLPNQDENHRFCFDLEGHFIKRFMEELKENNLKKQVVDCIDVFFQSAFRYIEGGSLPDDEWRLTPYNYHPYFNSDINKDNNLIVFNAMPINFSMIGFFKYWSESSKNKNFSIISNELIKSIPFDSDKLSSLNCYFDDISSIPYLKNWNGNPNQK
jgi:hypothetical protein